MTVRFLFVCEGSLDEGLVEHLETLCLQEGIDEVSGIAPDLRRHPISTKTVEEKARLALQLEPDANLLFIHRDADAKDPAPRYHEIERAIRAMDTEKQWVSVVPVQETEAWLLLDEEAIRLAADNPKGNVSLDLPTPGQVESISDPREKLQSLLTEASELSGRHLKRFKRDLSKHCRYLLSRLDTEGPLNQVPSWKRLREDVNAAISDLASDEL